jgi:hypothetical protein
VCAVGVNVLPRLIDQQFSKETIQCDV